jgi:hypothetical protein
MFTTNVTPDRQGGTPTGHHGCMLLNLFVLHVHIKHLWTGLTLHAVGIVMIVDTAVLPSL